MYGLGFTDQDIVDVMRTVTPSSSRRLNPLQPFIPDTESARLTTKTVSNSLDMFILGPALVYAGLGKSLPKPMKGLLLMTGIGTVMVALGNALEKQS